MSDYYNDEYDDSENEFIDEDEDVEDDEYNFMEEDEEFETETPSPHERYSHIFQSIEDRLETRKELPFVKDNLSELLYGHTEKPDITALDINEIKGCGKFSPNERAEEYRRRGKSPSGVIDGVYNDSYRGNGAYNDSYRDWEANA